MIDPTFFIPDGLKQRFVDWLVESVAGQAEKVGSDQAARVIRKLSADAVFRASADRALQTGIERFIEEYREQDEDLVDALVQDATFWESAQVQQALKDVVEHPGASMPDQARVIAGHFDTVLPQRVNRKRVNAAVSYLLGCIAQELWSLPGANEVREIYSLQFQKITAEESREQTALMRQQLETTRAFNTEIRQAFLQLAGAMEKTLLAAPALPALVASPRPYNNLPQPTYVRFVGRDAELAWLRERLSPTDRAWQIVINGIGGIGKTALAFAIADEYRRRYHELPPEERFEAIIWVSAKEDVLTAQGRERADLPEAILHTLEDVYTAIARVLEREDITRAVPEEQDALVQKALQRQRTLLVMDNMESVEDDRIKAFLRKLPAPTKAIITSRDWIDVADGRVLRGLSPQDAETLIQEEAAVREIVLNAKQRERLYDLTAGLPLPLKLGIARMSAGESLDAVTRWLGDATGDLPEYCVRGQVNLVRERDPNAWTVLRACSLFDREAGASREALGEISDLSLVDRDHALLHLQKLFLVNLAKGDRFWILPIVQRYVVAEFGDNEENIIVNRWIEWMTIYAESHGSQVTVLVENLDKMETEYPNLQLAIQFLEEREAWPQLARLCASVQRYTYQVSLYIEHEAILHAWLKAVRQTNDKAQEGRVLLEFGRLMSIWNRDELSWDYLVAAEELLQATDLQSDLAEIWTTRSQLLSRNDELDKARELAYQVLELGERTSDVEIKLTAAHLLADIERQSGHLDVAMDWMTRAEPWAAESRSPQKTAGIWDRKATLLLQAGKVQEAEKLLLASLEINAAFRTRRFTAFVKYYLAQVYAATGRIELARRTAEEALDLYDRIGMSVWQNRVRYLLTTLM